MVVGTDAHCRRCGGTGRVNADPDANFCDLCGGDGLAHEGSSGRGVPAGPGNVSFLLSLLFLISVLAAPIVAVVIVADWLYAAAGPIRTVLELLPVTDAVARVPQERGAPGTVAAIVGGVLLVILIVVWVVHGHAVKHSSRRAGRLIAYGWGVLVAAVILFGVPLVMHAAAIASGADLREQAPDSRFTAWWHAAIVIGLAALFGLVLTGWRSQRARRRLALA